MDIGQKVEMLSQSQNGIAKDQRKFLLQLPVLIHCAKKCEVSYFEYSQIWVKYLSKEAEICTFRTNKLYTAKKIHYRIKWKTGNAKYLSEMV